MAKTRNKKNKKKNSTNGLAPMDTSTVSFAAGDGPQAMDTSEVNPSVAALGPIDRKIKKGPSVRRSKSIRKGKAIARAICNSEKITEKVSKSKKKMLSIQSAKTLYD